MKDDYTTNSYYLTYAFLFKKLGECNFLIMGMKGLRIAWVTGYLGFAIGQPFASWNCNAIFPSASIFIRKATDHQARMLVSPGFLSAQIVASSERVAHGVTLHLGNHQKTFFSTLRCKLLRKLYSVTARHVLHAVKMSLLGSDLPSLRSKRFPSKQCQFVRVFKFRPRENRDERKSLARGFPSPPPLSPLGKLLLLAPMLTRPKMEKSTGKATQATLSQVSTPAGAKRTFCETIDGSQTQTKSTISLVSVGTIYSCNDFRGPAS